ncbi:MAG: hypothetical protein ACOVOR_00115 [Rhabdochlamydiaceae bacterium]
MISIKNPYQILEPHQASSRVSALSIKIQRQVVLIFILFKNALATFYQSVIFFRDCQISSPPAFHQLKCTWKSRLVNFYFSCFSCLINLPLISTNLSLISFFTEKDHFDWKTNVDIYLDQKQLFSRTRLSMHILGDLYFNSADQFRDDFLDSDPETIENLKFGVGFSLLFGTCKDEAPPIDFFTDDGSDVCRDTRQKYRHNSLSPTDFEDLRNLYQDPNKIALISNNPDHSLFEVFQDIQRLGGYTTNSPFITKDLNFFHQYLESDYNNNSKEILISSTNKVCMLFSRTFLTFLVLRLGSSTTLSPHNFFYSLCSVSQKIPISSYLKMERLCALIFLRSVECLLSDLLFTRIPEDDKIKKILFLAYLALDLITLIQLNYTISHLSIPLLKSPYALSFINTLYVVSKLDQELSVLPGIESNSYFCRLKMIGQIATAIQLISFFVLDDFVKK